MMNEAAAEARRAYQRKWAREHRDRVRAHQEKYWQRKAAADVREPEQAKPTDTAAETS